VIHDPPVHNPSAVHDPPVSHDRPVLDGRPGLDDRPIRQDLLPRAGLSVRALTAAGLLAAALVAWSALPLASARAGARPALLAGAACAILSVLQLAISSLEIPEPIFDSLPVRVGRGVLAIIAAAPWAEGVTVAVLVLEALHHSRPWHTAVLGAALVAFLLALHCGESRASARVLRSQLPLLAAGAGLLVLAAGAAALPPLGTGPGSVLLRVLAAIAALIAGALAVPF
jgi:hypothetical protein